MRYKVYLAKLKRKNVKPTCVYKVGIMKSADAMARLTYTGYDEPFPIVGAFPDIKVMTSIWCENEEEALALESKIMDNIKGSERWFHNWYEKDQLSGITEMRVWDYDEIQRVFAMINSHRQEKYESQQI